MEELTYNFRLKDAIIGAQMLLVAFGALVLVPLLTGLNSNVALFTAGIGTLLFQIVTRGKVPIFLASSFAFIAPISYGVQTWGLTATLGGMIAVGLFYMVLSFIIKVRGIGFIINLLPPIVTGSVIAVIGLILAPTGMKMAMGIAGTEQVIPQNTALIVSMSSLVTTILVSLLGKGILRLLPILAGIIVGCIVAAFMGILDLSPVADAKWFALPPFVFPTFELAPILYFIPVALAPAIEHFGDILAISSVTGRNFLEKPGISRTMFGDGIATSLACFFGGPPNTTYSEVTGAVALTRGFSPAIMTWAAITAILLSCVGKLGAVLHCVPMPVMGGIMVLLFGSIMVVGLNTLVQSRENLMETRNLVIVAMVIIFGIGGISIDIGEFHLSGIGLSAIIGVFLNLILPGKKYHHVEPTQRQ